MIARLVGIAGAREFTIKCPLIIWYSRVMNSNFSRAVCQIQTFPCFSSFLFFFFFIFWLHFVWLWHLILAHNYAVCIVPRTMDTKDMFALIIRLGHCTYKLILSCFKCQFAWPASPLLFSRRQCRTHWMLSPVPIKRFLFSHSPLCQTLYDEKPGQNNGPVAPARFAIFRLGFLLFSGFVLTKQSPDNEPWVVLALRSCSFWSSFWPRTDH